MWYMMWLLTWIGMILGATTVTVAGAPAPYLVTANRSVPGVVYNLRIAAGVRVHVISVDMRNAELMVRPAFAWGEPGHGQSFARFLAQHRPLAQISGGYFSPHNWLPIGDIVIDSQLRYQGGIGSALAMRTDNTLEIRDVPRGGPPWSGYEAVMRGGLRLVHGGALAITARRQGFRDPALFRATSRTAVGLTSRTRLLLVATSAGISLTKLAAVMKGLGCTEAMTLDGGASTGLAFGGSIILNPARKLSTVLLVQARPTPPPRPAAQVLPAPSPVSMWPFSPATPVAGRPRVPRAVEVDDVALLPMPDLPAMARRALPRTPVHLLPAGRAYGYRGYHTV